MTPWYPNSPVWETMAPAAAEAMCEHFEERSAVMEFEGGYSRGGAELFCYAFLVDRLAQLDAIDIDPGVALQVERARRIRSDWAVSHSIGAYV